MFFEEELVQCHIPVCDAGLFTTEEIQEVLSLLQTEPVSPNSGSEGSNRSVYSLEERKKGRMMSNRESARRSRWRKKTHLENLQSQVNQLGVENRELKNRFSLVMNQYYLVERDNDHLRTESLALWARFSDLYQIIVAMQMQPQ